MRGGPGSGPGPNVGPVGILRQEFKSLNWELAPGFGRVKSGPHPQDYHLWTLSIPQEPPPLGKARGDLLELGWMEESNGHVFHRLRAALRTRELRLVDKHRKARLEGCHHVAKRTVTDLLRTGELKCKSNWTDKMKARMMRWRRNQAVSYTHLTLPTICSV